MIICRYWLIHEAFLNRQRDDWAPYMCAIGTILRRCHSAQRTLPNLLLERSFCADGGNLSLKGRAGKLKKPLMLLPECMQKKSVLQGRKKPCAARHEHENGAAMERPFGAVGLMSLLK